MERAVDGDVPVKSLQTTFEIITVLREQDGAGISTLSDLTGLPVSTVHDHVRTLERLGYVVSREDEYCLGIRFLELGGYARSTRRVYDVSVTEVEKLAYDTGEHANLLVEENGFGHFLYQAKGDDAVRLETVTGERVHLHATALGKAILAHLPQDRVAEIIDRRGLPARTNTTITEREALFEELDVVREQGYATEDEEYVRGMRCVAAPIRDEDGEVLGAISSSGPVSRMQGQRFTEEIPDTVRRTTNIVEVNINHS
ncbi:IclR family transcriptional regulator [Halorubellus sp. JP-L1]|uniref:IclR family transcriptional regulator n=1 Tax=Halorubellus sp. JP-L1 TaxID=2715753 RepID=UPI001408222C|nr:IclR family transcriptional regulator [Halorubellus sp. JP-L1]NHN42927.1 IclR family transcriptional regulator [Halorubellus sp. JP-L1]